VILVQCDRCKTQHEHDESSSYRKFDNYLCVTKTTRQNLLGVSFDIKLNGGPQYWNHICQTCWYQLLYEYAKNKVEETTTT